MFKVITRHIDCDLVKWRVGNLEPARPSGAPVLLGSEPLEPCQPCGRFGIKREPCISASYELVPELNLDKPTLTQPSLGHPGMFPEPR